MNDKKDEKDVKSINEFHSRPEAPEIKEPKELLETNIQNVDKPISKYQIKADSSFKIEFSIKEVIDEDKKNRFVPSVKDEGDENHWVRFRLWSYAIESKMKQKCTEYDEVKRVHYLDQDKLNIIKVQRLLHSWSFEGFDAGLKLHHVNGVLTDESLNNFFLLYPAIVKYLILHMNAILEEGY